MPGIEQFAGRFQGQTVYVLGAGPSLDDVDPEFFADKPTIGKGYCYRRFPCDLVVEKHHEFLPTMVGEAPCPIVVSRRQYGSGDGLTVDYGNVYTFEHATNRGPGPIDFSRAAEDGRLVVSHSTITSAIHLAAVCGAADILVAGHDGGTVGGKLYFDGYRSDVDVRPENISDSEAKRLVDSFERQTLEVCAWLRETYGVRVYGLNPWITMRMGGRKVDE